nr:putative transmembrane protein (PGPGW) [uncultured bacterium]
MGDEQEEPVEIPSVFKRIIQMKGVPWLRKAIVAVVGFTVVLLGVVMIVTPGPALVVIPLGLAILATEFIWAKRLLKWSQEQIKKKLEKVGVKTKAKAD